MVNKKIIESNIKTQIINEIMSSFNFKKVKAYMDLVEWKYAHDDGTMRVPDIETIKSTAYKMLIRLNEFGDYSSTGGFTATLHNWNGGTIILTFNIAEFEYSKNEVETNF